MELVMSLVVYTQIAWWILFCFYLIYSSLSRHIRDIIELGKTEELIKTHQIECNRLEKYSTPCEHDRRLLQRREWHNFVLARRII